MKRLRRSANVDGRAARAEIEPLALYGLILDVATRVRDRRASQESTSLPAASNAMLDEIARNAAQVLYAALAAMELDSD